MYYPPRLTRFASRPGSSKVHCVVCGREGYAFGRWQEACLRGHAPCGLCGMVVMSVTLAGRPRRGHNGCPREMPSMQELGLAA